MHSCAVLLVTSLLLAVCTCRLLLLLLLTSWVTAAACKWLLGVIQQHRQVGSFTLNMGSQLQQRFRGLGGWRGVSPGRPATQSTA
jgi:hypothetical protein